MTARLPGGLWPVVHRTFLLDRRALPPALAVRRSRQKERMHSDRECKQPNKTKGSQMKEYDIVVNYEATSCLSSNSDPEHYLVEINFKIIGLSEEEEITLGEGHATQVRINQALEEHASLYEIFDVDQELTDTARSIFDTGFDDYHASVIKGFEDNFFPEDVLVVRRMTLSPQFRGQKIGLSVLHRIIMDLGHGCGLVVIKPYPLMGPVRVGCEKLRKYWAQLGFERVGKSNYWGLSMHLVLNSAAELGLPSSLIIDDSKTKQ